MTKIEWADETWNPITGCSPISIGCENCYARRMANRLRGRFGYPKDDPFKVTFHLDRLNQPLKWKKSRRIFVCSMGDLFHENLKRRTGYGTEWERIYQVYEIILKADWHTYIILTKRPENMRQFYQEWIFPSDCIEEDNIWLGVTVENQKTVDERIPILLQIPAKVRFVSIEPMLERIDLLTFREDLSPSAHFYYLDHIDWVICGAETGQGARPFNLDWARNLRDQCRDVGVPFFFKSAGKQEITDDLMFREFPIVN